MGNFSLPPREKGVAQKKKKKNHVVTRVSPPGER